jgi:DNA topoisomerase-1
MVRLRRSDPAAAGIRRLRSGRGFRYVDATGKRVCDDAVLERIAGLVIPPAWKDVWICPWPNGHIQVTGLDVAGRKQYLYHPDWTARQDREKWQRARSLGAVLPRMRKRLVEDLDETGLSRARVLSCAVRMIDLGLFRIGGESYARENESYGLATILREHVTISRGNATFTYPAKHGVQAAQVISDPAVVAVLAALLRRPDPSPELLGWWSRQDRAWRDVRSDHVNLHVREVSGRAVSAKDFRTWHATVLMALTLADAPPPKSATARKRNVVAAYRSVAGALGNTPSVAKGSYVDPTVVELYDRGVTLPPDLAHREAGGPELVTLRGSRAVLKLLTNS